jgi:hypothetical protein
LNSLVSVLCKLGGTWLESRYFDWYFYGFSYACYTNAAIVQLESIFPPLFVSIIAESLLLKELPCTDTEFGPTTVESVEPYSARFGA